MIEFSDVHVAYSGHPVLQGLDLSAADGRVTGLVGPNGAGKSTAFKVLLGLVPASRGTAHVDGLPYAQSPAAGLALGTYLGPERIPGGMTGRGFLQWTADLLAVPAGDLDSQLGVVGLAEAADRKVSGYSLGMRQRLGVAAAFLGDPRNLVLDEPVNGLDVEGVRWLRNYLTAAAARGRCVLLSSHVLSELELVADDVVFLGAGRAVQHGSLDELRSDADGAVVVTSGNNRVLARHLADAGFTVEHVGDHIHVRPGSVNQVAAAAAASPVALHSVARARRRLEDVYLAESRRSQHTTSPHGEHRS